MAISDLSPGAQRLLGYYGVIREGVNAGESTQQIWDRIKAVPVENPAYRFFGAGNAVSELRSYAAQVRNSSRALAAAPDAERIDARAIAREPWSSSLSGRTLPAEYTVRFQHVTVNSAGETETRWRTLTHVTDLGTKQELMGRLDAAGEGFSADYGTSHGGIGDVEITLA